MDLDLPLKSFPLSLPQALYLVQSILERYKKKLSIQEIIVSAKCILNKQHILVNLNVSPIFFIKCHHHGLSL